MLTTAIQLPTSTAHPVLAESCIELHCGDGAFLCSSALFQEVVGRGYERFVEDKDEVQCSSELTSPEVSRTLVFIFHTAIL